MPITNQENNILHIVLNQISANCSLQCICPASPSSYLVSLAPLRLASSFLSRTLSRSSIFPRFCFHFIPSIQPKHLILAFHLFCQSCLSIFESFAILFPPVLSVSSLFECVSYSFLPLPQISNRLLETQLSESIFFILYFK